METFLTILGISVVGIFVYVGVRAAKSDLRSSDDSSEHDEANVTSASSDLMGQIAPYEGPLITIDEVISNPAYYTEVDKHFKPSTTLLEESRRLEYGVHLMKQEQLRIRAQWAGLKSEFVEKIMPQYIPLTDFHGRSELRHARLREQADFLRAELHVQMAMLERVTSQSGET